MMVIWPADRVEAGPKAPNSVLDCRSFTLHRCTAEIAEIPLFFVGFALYVEQKVVIQSEWMMECRKAAAVAVFCYRESYSRANHFNLYNLQKSCHLLNNVSRSAR